MQAITKILDSSTDELSKALRIIWEDQKRLASDTDFKEIKEHLDYAQQMLLNLMCSLEDFGKKIALEFYHVEVE